MFLAYLFIVCVYGRALCVMICTWKSREKVTGGSALHPPGIPRIKLRSGLEGSTFTCRSHLGGLAPFPFSFSFTLLIFFWHHFQIVTLSGILASMWGAGPWLSQAAMLGWPRPRDRHSLPRAQGNESPMETPTKGPFPYDSWRWAFMPMIFWCSDFTFYSVYRFRISKCISIISPAVWMTHWSVFSKSVTL